MKRLLDRHARPLRKLRLSLTDRCNLRCRYCMPDRQPVWLPGDALLTREEIQAVVAAFAACGVSHVRLTGGEPLLRPDVEEIVRSVAAIAGVADISLTTNGVMLAERARALAAAGLRRVNISLDTLRGDCFAALAGADAHRKVVHGIEAARRHFTGLKLNAVIIRGVNDEEAGDLLAFGRDLGAEVRFIEYMDVTRGWSARDVVPRDEILARLVDRFGPARAEGATSDPAERFTLADGTRFGIIASVTRPFCGACDRTRVNAAGVWFRCLYAADGRDLRSVLRAQGPDALAAAIAGGWRARDERGADQRAALRAGQAIPLVLAQPPGGIGMHARGG